jgi:hypothetical protein
LLKNLHHNLIDQELLADVESKNDRIVDEDDVIRFRWKSKNFDRETSQLVTARKCFRKEMHDRIDESSNDVFSSYRYEDYQSYENARSFYLYEDYHFYENARSSNRFEDRLSFKMLSNLYEDRESFRHFELKISNSLRFESEIFLFDSNE